MNTTRQEFATLTGLVFLLVAFAGNARGVTIPTVPVGNPGNADDIPWGWGGVGYAYNIGTYEVTNAHYAKFLNAKATTDPLALYNTSMGSGFGGITRSGSRGKSPGDCGPCCMAFAPGRSRTLGATACSSSSDVISFAASVPPPAPWLVQTVRTSHRPPNTWPLLAVAVDYGVGRGRRQVFAAECAMNPGNRAVWRPLCPTAPNREWSVVVDHAQQAYLTGEL